MVASNIFFFILGLILLVQGADYLVEAASRLAKKLGVSELVIGLTIVALGTSLPELASSLFAVYQGYPGIVMGNVIGSNIANIGLVIGIAALFGGIKTSKRLFGRDMYILLFSVIMMLVFSLDRSFSMVEGLVLIALYGVYTLFIVRTRSKNSKEYKFRHFLEYLFHFKYITTIRSTVIRRGQKPEAKPTEKAQVTLFRQSLLADIVIILASIVAVAFGAQFLIEEAIWLATLLQVPATIVGLSVIAVGTSLPELIVSVKAAQKGLGDLIVGNVIGSNIANTFLVLGSASVVKLMPIAEATFLYTIPLMAFFTLFFAYVVRNDWRIKRWEGITSFILYVAFIVFSFMNGFA